jgi:hypothetical protein
MIGALALSGDKGLAPLVRWGLLLLLVVDGLTIAAAFRQPPPGPEPRRARSAAWPRPGRPRRSPSGLPLAPQAGHVAPTPGAPGPDGHPTGRGVAEGPVDRGPAHSPAEPTPPATGAGPGPTRPAGDGAAGGTISAGAGYGPTAEGFGRPPRPDRRAHRRELHGPLLDEAGMAEAVRRARSGRQTVPHALVVADLGAASGWEGELGPGVADRLHQAVAGVIRSAVRSTATAVGRDVQGRFVVHLSGLTKGLPATEAIVGRVADALATPVMVHDTLLSVSARFGVGLCVCGRCEYERLQELATRPAPGQAHAAHPARGLVITRCRPDARGWEARSR